MAGLVGRAKNIVQLRPRNPENPVRSSIPVKAICDYRQIEVHSWSLHFMTLLLLLYLFKSLVVNLSLTVNLYHNSFRLPFVRMMSVCWLITLTGPSGKSLTQQGMRPWCPLYVSLFLHPTKKLLIWLQGEMQIKLFSLEFRWLLLKV